MELEPNSIHRRAKKLTVFTVFLILLCYLPVLPGGFFSDDFPYIVNNNTLRELRAGELWRIFSERMNPWEYLPIRDLSYWVDLSLFGLNPTAFHAHNILLYGLCCAAAWMFLRSLIALFGYTKEDTDFWWICAAATVLFAAHPAHVESVAWISGRKDLLSGLFVLGSLWLFADGIRPDHPNWRKLILSYGFFVLALLSKLTVMPAVGIALLLTGLRFRTKKQDSLLKTMTKAALPVLPMVVLSAGFFILALWVGKISGIRLNPFVSEILQRTGILALSLKIMGHLVWIGVMPYHLRLIYDVSQPGVTSILYQLVGAFALIGGAVACFLAFRRRSPYAFAAAFFVLFCLPFLQLLPFNTWSFASERFLFLPVLGIAIVVSLLISRLRILRLAILFTVFGICAALTFNQAVKWSDWRRLVEDMARRAPAAYLAQGHYIDSVLLPARRFEEAKDAAEKVRWRLGREALKSYAETYEAVVHQNWAQAEKSARMLDFLSTDIHFPAQYLRGLISEKRADYFGAARYFYYAVQSATVRETYNLAEDALLRVRAQYRDTISQLEDNVRTRPDNLPVLGELANLKMELYMLEEAANLYSKILQRYPNLAAAHYNLGLTYSRQGRYQEAVQELVRAIEMGIDTSTAWNNLGIAYQYVGDFESAVAAFQKGTALNPRDCDPLLNLGRLYFAIREVEKARKAFLRASRSNCSSDLRSLSELYLKQVEEARSQ